MEHTSASAAKQVGLIVIGASAGGVETLRKVVGGLPQDLNAAVCVVLHLAPGSPSALAGILNRAGALPCRPAIAGEPLRKGEILVAPPDRHLVIRDGRVEVTVEPRENGHRPSVDVLFRSAAEAHDGHVLGVILSGTRDDGTAGLAVIKARGGTAIVQDPHEAHYAGLPASALAHVAVDAVATTEEIAGIIVRMVTDSGQSRQQAEEVSSMEPLPGQPLSPRAPSRRRVERVPRRRTEPVAMPGRTPLLTREPGRRAGGRG